MMAVLARSTSRDLSAGLERMDSIPTAEDLRQPETGLVMLRGRTGGTGAPFNLGEATVTRAVVRLDNGIIGFSYILGRDPAKARLAAIVDALWQDEARKALVETNVLVPIRKRLLAEDAVRANQTAATKVDFFTLVRGED